MASTTNSGSLIRASPYCSRLSNERFSSISSCLSFMYKSLTFAGSSSRLSSLHSSSWTYPEGVNTGYCVKTSGKLSKFETTSAKNICLRFESLKND